MPNTVQEVYNQQILPMSEKERLKLIELIVRDISNKPEINGDEKKSGGIREMFGTWKSGNPNSANNEQIDADLGREYGSTHEDE